MPNVPETKHDRASLCYATAYFALPQYVFNKPKSVLNDFAKDPNYQAKFFYVMACKMSQSEPHEEDVRAITAQSVDLGNGWKSYIVEYPKFPPIDLSSLAQSDMVNDIRNVVLAPYFSAILFRNPENIEHYFVLGQSPMGGTTFREVRQEANANLGEGCEPTLALFAEFLRMKLGRHGTLPKPVAVVVRPAPIEKKTWWQFWRR
jgi:hypothetical protein